MKLEIYAEKKKHTRKGKANELKMNVFLFIKNPNPKNEIIYRANKWLKEGWRAGALGSSLEGKLPIWKK